MLKSHRDFLVEPTRLSRWEKPKFDFVLPSGLSTKLNFPSHYGSILVRFILLVFILWTLTNDEVKSRNIHIYERRVCRVPAEPKDDIPHCVHDAAPHTVTLLLLLLRNSWNRKQSKDICLVLDSYR